MTKDEIFSKIVNNTKEVVFELEAHQFKMEESLKDLGANSIDRSEIIMMTLEDLELNVPLIEFAKVPNLRELTNVIHAKLS